LAAVIDRKKDWGLGLVGESFIKVPTINPRIRWGGPTIKLGVKVRRYRVKAKE